MPSRLLLATLLPLAACRYVEQRVADLHDCVLYRWHDSAFGLAAVGKVGPLELALGGWYADPGLGKDTWWQVPGTVLTNHGYGVPITTVGPIAYGQHWSWFLATSASGSHPEAPGAFVDVRSWLLLGDVFDLDDSYPFRLSPRQRVADLFGVEIGVVPVAIGLHVGFNLLEFVDFALGFAGIDLLGDDGQPRPPTVPVLPVQGREPWVPGPFDTGSRASALRP